MLINAVLVTVCHKRTAIGYFEGGGVTYVCVLFPRHCSEA